jgi:3-deoxy-manno-octulosonate cytidylyltransferase (CMP-KDO synthetase)
MKTLAVIPARLESTRFPRKPLALLAGRPLVEHVWSAVRRSQAVERVIVATDSDEIAAAVERFGGEVVRTRGAHLTGSDRVAEVASQMGPGFDAILNVQGDQPLLDPGSVREAVRALALDPLTPVATLAAPDTDRKAYESPHVVKVVCDLEGRALYFSRAPLGGTEDATGAWRFLHHLGVYAFRPDALGAFASWSQSPLERAESLEQLRLVEHGIRIRVTLVRQVSRGVDTPEDLAALESDTASAAAGPTRKASEVS